MNKLYAVGIGPGEMGGITLNARRTLEKCQIIVGYKGYVELVRPHFPEKEYLHSGMMQEADRCRAALELAAAGKSVALICSGDAGVYGMAGLAHQLSPEYPGVQVEVVPGVSAAQSGGAMLGAPLGHDFAVISLSDLLTPWELIEKRLRCAAGGDMCICLYNPASRRRADYLRRACNVLLETLPPDTVCGAARNTGREGETARVLTLEELRDYEADMFTTAFIGNSTTLNIGGRMVTPRGYRDV